MASFRVSNAVFEESVNASLRNFRILRMTTINLWQKERCIWNSPDWFWEEFLEFCEREVESRNIDRSSLVPSKEPVPRLA